MGFLNVLTIINRLITDNWKVARAAKLHANSNPLLIMTGIFVKFSFSMETVGNHFNGVVSPNTSTY